MGTLLGQELRRLRKERSLTLDEVANETGITKQYISMLEKGQRKAVSFEIMVSISKYYGVPLDYFARFLEEEKEVNSLTDKELEVWQTINDQVHQEVFYKKGNLAAWFSDFFKRK